ncbi:phage major capsid protein [Polycladidibacter stylochi]|uniref:phage major capsid protein n=1 Tax=Polycladidibacter stylochi TaxID=1807766 RepID=UPI000B0E2CAA|nr:phage major capsid protein [Pseudovibrio stylochi]
MSKHTNSPSPLETKDLTRQPQMRPNTRPDTLAPKQKGQYQFSTPPKFSYVPDSVQAAYQSLNHAHDEFIKTNDTRQALEQKGQADVLLLEKLMRLDGELDTRLQALEALALKTRRPALSQYAHTTDQQGEAAEFAHQYRGAFINYMRKGADDSLRQLESKALHIGGDSDGGYLVPEQTEAQILTALTKVSPLRSIAGQRQVSASVYKRPFSINGPATGWVGETADRPQTQSPELAELAFPTMELYAMPAATQSLLDDSAVNVEEWIAQEVETAFAEQESEAFVSGTGNNMPTGFLAYPIIEETSWSWGKLGTIKTGVNGALPATAPTDKLIDLIYTLKSGYRQNASFVFNRKTQAHLRKLKDNDGNYIWQPPANANNKASLMGFPVVELEHMPDMSDNSLPIAFGDFARGYLVVDRLGVKILRDPYSAKPYVLFYITKRVGGGVQDFNAIKLMQLSA